MTVFAIYPQSIRHPKASNQISLLPPGDLKTECPGLPVCSEGIKVFGEPVFDAAQTPCKHHHHHMHIYLPYFKRGNSDAEKPFDFFFCQNHPARREHVRANELCSQISFYCECLWL